MNTPLASDEPSRGVAGQTGASADGGAGAADFGDMSAPEGISGRVIADIAAARQMVRSGVFDIHAHSDVEVSRENRRRPSSHCALTTTAGVLSYRHRGCRKGHKVADINLIKYANRTLDGPAAHDPTTGGRRLVQAAVGYIVEFVNCPCIARRPDRSTACTGPE
ncbi:hypothetical protein HDG34_000250 [Paraburkholderia sp. HC6.4b]|nr:hypothetical protein [Paraburkholderia sp. HC6.4b]MBB5448733.1 hypothetical protein [Paraburkholderia sp. Kb1A]